MYVTCVRFEAESSVIEENANKRQFGDDTGKPQVVAHYSVGCSLLSILDLDGINGVQVKSKRQQSTIVWILPASSPNFMLLF